MNKLYPLLFKPVYKDYIWGGNRIAQRYGRSGTPAVCAESWEIADRPEGMSEVSNGVFKGRTLQVLVDEFGEELLGVGCKDTEFPLLIKIIDAKQDLSVQVHPNDDNAHLTGGEPKTEMWYVLDADPHAQIYIGLKSGTTPEQFKASILDGSLDNKLIKIPAKPGRAIFVEGGTVHAIGAGCLLLEIQQNSNTTYRVYDWGRVGSDGKPRDLHVDQAMQVIDWETTTPDVRPPRHVEQSGPNSWWEIVKCPLFRTDRVDLSEPEELIHDRRSFQALFVAKGKVLIGGNGIMASAEAGTSCLIPAAVGQYTLTPIGGSAASVVRIIR
jgi:mannose-6-phosphate isomerase